MFVADCGLLTNAAQRRTGTGAGRGRAGGGAFAIRALRFVERFTATCWKIDHRRAEGSEQHLHRSVASRFFLLQKEERHGRFRERVGDEPTGTSPVDS